MRIMNWTVGVLFVVASMFSISLGWSVGTNNKFINGIEYAKGKVLAMEAGLLVVNFDNPIINVCGDTSIYGFVTTHDGLTLQLKPVFIPERKAQAYKDNFEGNTLIFPVWDIMPFVSMPGPYGVEIFVENNCSTFNDAAVALEPFTFEIKPEGTAI